MPKPFAIIFLTIQILSSVYSSDLFSQLKIGASGAPNPNAMLEIQSTNRGLLLPRVALTSTTSPAPLSSFVKGMLVYDTATINDITPGMYYSDGTQWIKVNNPNLTNLNITGELIIDSIENGDQTTDNILVIDSAGKVKSVSSSSFISGVQKVDTVVATSGQTVFSTPANITNTNKVLLYRNGVMISFTALSNNTIQAEIASEQGDEIKIVQLE